MTIKLITEIKDRHGNITAIEKTLRPGDKIYCKTRAFNEEGKGIAWEGTTFLETINENQMVLKHHREELDYYNQGRINGYKDWGYYWLEPKTHTISLFEKFILNMRGLKVESKISWTQSKERS